MGPNEVNNKQENGQNPKQDGYKHHPAESRNVEILCPRNQNPHHGATQLQKRKKIKQILISDVTFDNNTGNKDADIFNFPAPGKNTGYEWTFKDWNSEKRPRLTNKYCYVFMLRHCTNLPAWQGTFSFSFKPNSNTPFLFHSIPTRVFFFFFKKDKIKNLSTVVFDEKEFTVMMCQVPELPQCSILDLMSQKLQYLHLNTIYPGVINNSITYYVYF